MIELFDIWWKWKFQIGALCLLAIITSFVVSMPAIMPPYYSAKAEFYPSNPAATDRNTLFSTERENYINYFGGNDDIDRIISLARSSGLAGYIIDKYNLIEHYKVDTTRVKDWHYVIRKKFDDNYSSSKTDRSSVEIVMLDHDPVRAANMVSDMVEWINQRNQGMISENKSKTLLILRDELNSKKIQLTALMDSSKRSVGAETMILQDRQEGLADEINDLEKFYSQYKISASDKFSSLYMIEYPTPADKKSKPVRWMIVVATSIISFIIASALAILLEYFKKQKAEAHA